MKALLFALVRDFEFDFAVPPHEIVRKVFMVARPTLVTNPSAGPQLPMIIRLVKS
jgi:hypothetical protein